MAEQVHYFGPSERFLFGVVHWPERSVQPGVMICPLIGYEWVCAPDGLRALVGARFAEFLVRLSESVGEIPSMSEAGT